jgi:uroporphyrin-III C-methyltransferase
MRAARLLAQADVVFYDALIHPETLELAVRAEKVAVGKRCGRHSTAQRFINKRLIDAALKYAVIVRLKGGDPMIFARSQEEIDALEEAGISVEVVPGVTAALAAAAQLRVSLTRRGVSRNFAIATPRVGAGEATSNWSAALSDADTAAIYMGAAQAEQVTSALLAQGHRPDTPVALCESVSMPQFRALRGTLSNLPALCQQLGNGPAVILLGKVFEKPGAATGANCADLMDLNSLAATAR